MTVLEPSELSTVIAECIGVLERGIRAGGGGSGIKQRRESLGQAYRWMHGAAYGPSSTEPPAATTCITCLGQGWVGARRCEQCTPNAHGDPTGDAVATRARQAAACERVSKALNAVRTALMAVAATVQSEFEKGDDPIPTPLTEPRAGVKQAQEAAERRAARGEGHGAA